LEEEEGEEIGLLGSCACCLDCEEDLSIWLGERNEVAVGRGLWGRIYRGFSYPFLRAEACDGDEERRFIANQLINTNDMDWIVLLAFNSRPTFPEKNYRPTPVDCSLYLHLKIRLVHFKRFSLPFFFGNEDSVRLYSLVVE
jgi:hypothetical protein